MKAAMGKEKSNLLVRDCFTNKYKLLVVGEPV